MSHPDRSGHPDFIPLICVVALTALAGCFLEKNPDKAKAGAATTPQLSPVTKAIQNHNTNAQAAFQALEKKYEALLLEREAMIVQSAKAAAQVTSAQIANTSQPPSPATSVVAGETSLALTNLPPADVAELLAAERRRTAVFAGKMDEANAMYAQARNESEQRKTEVAQLAKSLEQAKTEAADLRARFEKSQQDLLQAERKREDQLRANALANQALLDAAEARARKAEDERKNAETKEQVRALRVAGIVMLLAAIGIGVMTNGLQLMKSIGFGVGSVVCFGLAQLVAHPWFMPAVGITCVLTLAAATYWFIMEKKDGLAKDAYIKTMTKLDELHLVKDKDGKDTELGIALGRTLDQPHKQLVNEFKRTIGVARVKAQLVSLKAGLPT